MARQRATLHGLRATGKLEVMVAARRGSEIRRNRFRASQAILVARPASFRLEALSPFGVSYAVASDGQEITVWVPSERTVFRGLASTDNVAAALGIEASPADTADLLLGLPPAPPLELRDAWLSRPTAGAAAGSAEDDAVEPTLLLHATARDSRDDLVVVGFAPLSADDPSLVAVLFERITATGDLVLRARFAAFRPTAAGPVATRVEVQAHESQAVLRYTDLEVNPPLEASRFAVATPEGARELRLDAAGPDGPT